jgi:hypothetical protein
MADGRRLDLPALGEESGSGVVTTPSCYLRRTDDLPRSTTGKIQVHVLEDWLVRGQIPAE